MNRINDMSCDLCSLTSQLSFDEPGAKEDIINTALQSIPYAFSKGREYTRNGPKTVGGCNSRNDLRTSLP